MVVVTAHSPVGRHSGHEAYGCAVGRGRCGRGSRAVRRCGGRGDGARCPAKTGRGPHRLAGAGPVRETRERQAGMMFSACGPFGPWVTSKETF
ncbi:hypothetical protein GCM10017688_40510 [Streptomyces ramulosus]